MDVCVRGLRSTLALWCRAVHLSVLRSGGDSRSMVCLIIGQMAILNVGYVHVRACLDKASRAILYTARLTDVDHVCMSYIDEVVSAEANRCGVGPAAFLHRARNYLFRRRRTTRQERRGGPTQTARPRVVMLTADQQRQYFCTWYHQAMNKSDLICNACLS